MFINCPYYQPSETDILSLFSRFKSRPARQIAEQVRQSVQTDASVIITGEINTGKRWTARAIHYAGNHSKGPFMEISCLTLSNERIRDELFGHISYSKEGIIISHQIFQQANGGTLLIDAFTSLPTEMQLHLVSIMEHISTRKVLNQSGDVLDLQMILTLDASDYRAVKKETFWKQLIDRMNPIHIQEPPLRERREDIPVLVELFTNSLANKYQVAAPSITFAALYKHITYNWPGNLRQLRNAIEYALIQSDGSPIDVQHLPLLLNNASLEFHYYRSIEKPAALRSLIEAEKQLFAAAFMKFGQTDYAARKLGIAEEWIKNRLGTDHPLYLVKLN